MSDDGWMGQRSTAERQLTWGEAERCAVWTRSGRGHRGSGDDAEVAIDNTSTEENDKTGGDKDVKIGKKNSEAGRLQGLRGRRDKNDDHLRLGIQDGRQCRQRRGWGDGGMGR